MTEKTPEESKTIFNNFFYVQSTDDRGESKFLIGTYVRKLTIKCFSKYYTDNIEWTSTSNKSEFSTDEIDFKSFLNSYGIIITKVIPFRRGEELSVMKEVFPNTYIKDKNA